MLERLRWRAAAVGRLRVGRAPARGAPERDGTRRAARCWHPCSLRRATAPKPLSLSELRTSSRKRSPRASKSANWSKLAQAGREQHHLPAARRSGRRGTARSSSPHSCTRHRPAPAERLPRSAGPSSPIRYTARQLRAHRLAQRREVLVLALAAEDQVDRRRASAKASSATSVLATFVALESFT